jgi:hypothetical protein
MSEIDEEEIERRFEAISRFEQDPEATARDLQRIRENLTVQMSTPQTRAGITGGTILKSRVTRLAMAAGVTIAAMIILHQFGGSIDVAKPAYGLGDLPGLIKKTKTVHIKGWVYSPRNKQADTEPVKLEFEHWFDIENGRYRLYKPGGIDEVTGQPKYYMTVSDAQYIMEDSYHRRGDESWKSVSFVKLSPFQQRLQMRTTQPFSPFIENPNQVKGFAKIGQERIKNRAVDVWQGEVSSPDQTVPYKRLKIWLSPSTGEILRLFFWINAEKDSVRWLPLMDADAIEYNVAPPPDCFKTDPAEGYKLANTKETAIERELGDDGRLRFYVCIGFTLSDGSVIVGWHANHKPEESQAHLFENLTPGGPLPKLPAQVAAVKPRLAEEDITCVGHHLAFTRKAGKFYEWGLYVPNRKTPKRETFQDYMVVREYSGVEPRSFLGHPNLVKEEVTIASEQEFDTWVRGAMAELSDDANAPEYVTYQSVLKLAEKIRNSLTSSNTP